MRVEDLIVEVRNPSLERIGQITPQDLVGATFVVRYNNVGTWAISLPHGHPMGEFLRLPGYGILLTGPDDEPILSGPTLSAKLTQDQNDTEGTWEIIGASDDITLSERLAYPTPSTADVTAQTSSYDTRTGVAETVIKEYVDANIGPSAPVARQLANLTIETNSFRGDTVYASARFDGLQELIYDLAQVGGIGYRIAQIDSALEFSVFEPTDRSDTIRMDIQNRKLSSSVYSYGTAKVTRAIVAGSGEAETRIFVERTNTDSLDAETTWGRRIEVFKDARQTDSTDELNTSGDELLADIGKTIVEMSVTPSDDETMVYGVDWFLGDRVTVVANEIESSAVVTEVGIQIASDGVRIGATVGTPVGIEFESKILAKQQETEVRVSNLERNNATSGGGGVAENGLPTGGVEGQIIVKDSSTNFDVSWQDNYADEVRAIAYNDSGGILTKGTPVMVTGTAGDHIKVDKAVADGSVEPRFIFGVVSEDFGNGQQGLVTLLGIIDDLDTSAYSVGDILWIDPAVPGGWTTTEPSAPNLAMSIAFVTRSQAVNGRVYVRMYNQQPGLHELHDVDVSTVADGDILVYNSASQIWEAGTYAYADLTGIPSTFAPSAHTHPISQVVDLQTSLDAKANLAGATFTGAVTAPDLSLTGTQALADARARNVTVSSSEPSGGNIGDIWIQV